MEKSSSGCVPQTTWFSLLHLVYLDHLVYFHHLAHLVSIVHLVNMDPESTWLPAAHPYVFSAKFLLILHPMQAGISRMCAALLSLRICF